MLRLLDNFLAKYHAAKTVGSIFLSLSLTLSHTLCFSLARSLSLRAVLAGCVYPLCSERLVPGFRRGHCKVAFRRDRLEEARLSSGRPLSPFDHPAMLFGVLPVQRGSLEVGGEAGEERSMRFEVGLFPSRGLSYGFVGFSTVGFLPRSASYFRTRIFESLTNVTKIILARVYKNISSWFTTTRNRTGLFKMQLRVGVNRLIINQLCSDPA